MKRSFLTVLAASSLLVLGACSADDNSQTDTTTDAAAVPAPTPAPAPDSGAMATPDSGAMATPDSTTTTGM